MACSYASITDETLDVLGLDEAYRSIVRYGVHMRVPRCCIAYYSRVWIDWRPGGVPDLYERSGHDPDEPTRSRLWAEHPEFMRLLEERFRYLREECNSVGYVVCPQCLASGYRVQVRAVDKTCGCWPTLPQEVS